VRWRRAQTRSGDGEQITYAVGLDITGEQEMLRRTLRAERLAAVGTMAAGLAHEVRNPLNSASLQLTVLERRLERGQTGRDSTLPVLTLVKDEISRLDRLVRDFLAFSQPQPPERNPIDLNALLRSLAQWMGPEAEAGKIQVVLQLADPLPGVMGDSERLRQVLMNLMRNATEAMPDGGRLTLKSRAVDGSVEIDVEDSGHGFAEALPVFDAFFTTKSQGTGLGLAIVHRIVTDHGGNIRVRSAPGATVFTIGLPGAPA
jgi:signal transduction histidine kinase